MRLNRSLLPPIDPVGSSLASDRTCPAGRPVLRTLRPGAFFSALNLPAVGSDQARQRLLASTGRLFVSRGRAFRQVSGLACAVYLVRPAVLPSVHQRLLSVDEQSTTEQVAWASKKLGHRIQGRSA